ncbi:MAG: hypothetical protein P8N09_09570 [Planctomycetota bacterium]|jgi:hypothetical protein|nr:hypothetical protein [Planctomycetota bacterium]
MPTNPLPPDKSWKTESPDQPDVPAEGVYLLLALALMVIFSLAGVTAEPDPEVSDGSSALRQGWLEQHNQTQAPTRRPTDSADTPAVSSLR